MARRICTVVVVYCSPSNPSTQQPQEQPSGYFSICQINFQMQNKLARWWNLPSWWPRAPGQLSVRWRHPSPLAQPIRAKSAFPSPANRRQGGGARLGSSEHGTPPPVSNSVQETAPQQVISISLAARGFIWLRPSTSILLCLSRDYQIGLVWWRISNNHAFGELWGGADRIDRRPARLVGRRRHALL